MSRSRPERVLRKAIMRARLRRGLARALIISAVFATAGSTTFVALALRDLPDPSVFQNHVVRQSTKIYDRTGETLLFEVHGQERRTVITLEEIPMHARWATLAAEDTAFYYHRAFDLRAIARAAWHNVTREEGEALQGGSTITQQLVKNAFLEPERTFSRKIREVVLAIELERRFSKDQILELYLNQIPYGADVYGIEAAARHYFGKSAADLTLAESATLAAMIRAPSFYAANPDTLASRASHVLNRMANAGWITPEEAETAAQEPIRFIPPARGMIAPHFVMYVKQILEERFGKEMMTSGGLRVITTLDLNLQRIAEPIVAEVASINAARFRAANAALVAQDPQTGQVLAMVGSRNFFGASSPLGCIPGRTCAFDPQVNVAMRQRQPGSAFKPFIYYTAFDKGYSPATVLFDVPTEFNPNCNAASVPIVPGAICYRPQNYDGSWRGPVSMRQALAQSLNIPAVKTLYLVSIENSLKTAKDFGITTLTQPPGFYGLSLALGGGGVQLNELTHAYSVLAADGMYRPQTVILRIEDSEGNILDEFEDRPQRVANPQAVRLVNDVLADSPARSPVFAPGALDLPGHNVAVKTGTSQDYRDAWIFGYTPSLVTGVWAGNNNNAPMTAGGAGLATAAPILRTFMTQALPQLPQKEFLPANPLDLPAKPMLSGRYIVIENELPTMRSILHFVDRSDPLGPWPSNPWRDHQYANWEAAVRLWAGFALPLVPNPDNEPAPLPAPQPRIAILGPANDTALTSQEIKLEFVILDFEPEKISVSFNNRPVTELEPNPANAYSLFFMPASWQASNELRVTATSGSQRISQTIILHRGIINE